MTAGENRDRLREHLSAAGIGTMIHYASPLHKVPVFADYITENDAFPESERLSHEALSLPMYPELDDDDVDYICETLTSFNW